MESSPRTQELKPLPQAEMSLCDSEIGTIKAPLRSHLRTSLSRSCGASNEKGGREILSLSSKNVSPPNACVSPTNVCVSPPNACVSPTNVCVSPTNVCVSPTNVCVSPTNVCVSPTNVSVSPTDVCVSPTSESVSPTNGYISSTNGYVLPTSGYISPTNESVSPTNRSGPQKPPVPSRQLKLNCLDGLDVKPFWGDAGEKEKLPLRPHQSKISHDECETEKRGSKVRIGRRAVGSTMSSHFRKTNLSRQGSTGYLSQPSVLPILGRRSEQPNLSTRSSANSTIHSSMLGNPSPPPRTKTGLTSGCISKNVGGLCSYYDYASRSKDFNFKRNDEKASGTEMEMTSLHGYLYKQGVKGVTKNWKKRFFMMVEGLLIYYSGHPTQNGEKKGEIKIENITNIHTNLSFSGMKHLFGFQLETRERTFSLAALLEVEREYWVTSLFSLLSRPVPFPQETDVNPSADFIDELDIEGTGAVGRRGTAKTVNKCGEIGFTDATALMSEDKRFTYLSGESFSFGLKFVGYDCSYPSVVSEESSDIIMGYVLITNYRVLFFPFSSTVNIVQFPLLSIRKLARSDSRGKVINRVLDVLCVDVRVFRLVFQPKIGARRKFTEKLASLYPDCPKNSFCLGYFSASKEKNKLRGWDLYDLKREYERIGVTKEPNWRLTEINEEYRICRSYPPYLVIPAEISDAQVELIAAFRSKGRMPVLSWLHPVNKAHLSRCSQPGVGVKGKRCTADESLISLLGCGSRLTIIDARAKVAAVANTARGGGLESGEGYNIKMTFLNIDNIHAMRHSLFKFHDSMIQDGDENFCSAYYEWIGHIRNILSGAVRIAELMESGVPVLVHCSDGWDRTPQLTSLVLLLFDPYFRTIEGFAVLVEKEWCDFGHKFGDRIGSFALETDGEWSPVFLQFLESVWQLICQFPDQFEFNSKFLVYLYDEVYSGKCGTFLGNEPWERHQLNLKSSSYSVWRAVLENRSLYSNSLYPPEIKISPLRPRVSVKWLNLWRDAYFRYL